MTRRPIHLDPDGRWARAFAAIVAPRRPPPLRFVMSCIGCGCTDDRACAGGCYWYRPGICSCCAVAPDSTVLRPTKRVSQMFVVAACEALQSRRWTFRMPSVAVLAFDGGEDTLKTDNDRRLEGGELDATTTVRIARDGSSWSTRLVYRRAATTLDPLNTRWTYHLRFITKPAPRAMRRRR